MFLIYNAKTFKQFSDVQILFGATACFANELAPVNQKTKAYIITENVIIMRMKNQSVKT